jgi:hypothetical protein
VSKLFAGEIKARARQLVVQFHASGLSGMEQDDVRLLLSEKQLHLAQVSDRCSKGEGLHVNVPLKRMLEEQVREIGKAADGIDKSREGEDRGR